MLNGRKKLILAALVLCLGTAIYLNWQFSSAGSSLDLTTMLTSSKSLGDAKYVNENSNSKLTSSKSTTSGKTTSNKTTSLSADNFFAQQRVSRQKARDEAVATLKSVAEDTKIQTADKQAAVLKIAQMALNIEKENRAENAIKAKGFSDCVVTITDNTANVVVATSALTSVQAVQIKDIMVNDAGIASDKIKIVEVG